MKITLHDNERFGGLHFRYNAKKDYGLVIKFFKPDGTFISENKYDSKELRKHANPLSTPKWIDIDRGSHLVRIRGVYDEGIYLTLFERSGEYAWRMLAHYRLDKDEPKIEDDMTLNLSEVYEKISMEMIEE